MQFYDRLMAETKTERDAFLATPIIRDVLENGVSRGLYLDYLVQAYHHVKHTCPQLGVALSRAKPDDLAYRDALIEYIDEEKAHEQWILNDIEALGGNREQAKATPPNIFCTAMVGHVYYAIEHIHPHAMLGSVHVLEGISTMLADKVAAKVAGRLDIPETKGFSYLRSHGALDQEHVAFFRDYVNKLNDPAAEQAIIDTARVIYRLFAAMFTEIADNHEVMADAA